MQWHPVDASGHGVLADHLQEVAGFLLVHCPCAASSTATRVTDSRTRGSPLRSATRASAPAGTSQTMPLPEPVAATPTKSRPEQVSASRSA